MRIEVLPALNGDCILIEYEPQHYILIDGGYVDTYLTFLKSRLHEISKQGGVLDLVVVSHIDSDHISGIIKMLEEDEPPIPIRGIWYNGYRHVQSTTIVSEEKETFVHKSICKQYKQTCDKPISAKQGCTLSALIMRHGLTWNAPVNGGAIVAPFSIQLGDATLHVLSPSGQDIRTLGKFWKKRLIKDGFLAKAHSEEFWDDAFEFSLSNEKPGFHFHDKKVSKTFDLNKLKTEEYIPDDSATNGSSIAFVLETKDKRVLFMGDSHSETIEDSLASLYGMENQPYSFDAVKLSHHGSYNNNSPKLFELISADKWIVSTNGDKYNHPDMPTLAHIVTGGTGRELYFNYPLSICDELKKTDYHQGFNFEVIVPENGKGIIVTL